MCSFLNTHTHTYVYLWGVFHWHKLSPKQTFLTLQKCPYSAGVCVLLSSLCSLYEACITLSHTDTHTHVHTNTLIPCLPVFVSCRIIPDVNYCLSLVSEVNLIKVLNWTWTSRYKKRRQSLLNVIIKSSTQFKGKQKMTLLLAGLAVDSLLNSQAVPQRKPRQWMKQMKHICNQGWNTLKAAAELFSWNALCQPSLEERGNKPLCDWKATCSGFETCAIRLSLKNRLLWAQRASPCQHNAVCIWCLRDRLLLSYWSKGLCCGKFLF